MKAKIFVVVAVLVLLQVACAGSGGDGWNAEETQCAEAAEAAGYAGFETEVVGGVCKVNAGSVPGREIWVDLAAMPVKPAISR